MQFFILYFNVNTITLLFINKKYLHIGINIQAFYVNTSAYNL